MGPDLQTSVGVLFLDRSLNFGLHIRRDLVRAELHGSCDDLKFSSRKQLLIGELLAACRLNLSTMASVKELDIGGRSDTDGFGEFNLCSPGVADVRRPHTPIEDDVFWTSWFSGIGLLRLSSRRGQREGSQRQ